MNTTTATEFVGIGHVGDAAATWAAERFVTIVEGEHRHPLDARSIGVMLPADVAAYWVPTSAHKVLVTGHDHDEWASAIAARIEDRHAIAKLQAEVSALRYGA